METKRETKTVKSTRRKYDAEFKKDVIKMVETGRQVPDVAASLGIGTSLIYQWLRQSRRGTTSVEGPSFDNERASLYKQIRELEMERDILKKALGIFSRQK